MSRLIAHVFRSKSARWRGLVAAAVLTSVGASARPPDCMAGCENDKKSCELQCAKKVGGKNASTCKSACAELTDPCKDACKKKEAKRK